MPDAQKILSRLRREFRRGETFLDHRNTWELVVATQLSAQCTDARVNLVTKKLFRKYRKIGDYADAKPREFERDIFSTGFYRNKTRNILAAAKMVRDRFGFVVPNRMDDLLKIPGVGRKTANIILSQGFGLNEGIAVDTHVQRVSQRLGLTKDKSPEKIEGNLMKLVGPHEYSWLSTALIRHGRKTCHARKPACPECMLRKLCPSAGYFWKTESG